MKTFFIFLLLIPFLLLAQEREKIDISDTSIAKNYRGIAVNSASSLFLAGWDYDGGGIYEYDFQKNNEQYFRLFESKDIHFFTIKNLNYTTGVIDYDILLAGGFYKKCLCGVLLKRDNQSGQWSQIYFDDAENPFAGNIFDITINSVNKYGKKFARIFIACANGAIFYSEDNASTFQKAKINAGNGVIRKLVFTDKFLGYAIAGDEQFYLNKLYKTEDGGLNWDLVQDFTKDNILINNLLNLGDTLLLCGSQFSKGVILLSKDAGTTFEFVKYNNGYLFPKALVSLNSDDNNIYAVDENGVVYRSKREALNFERLTAQSQIGVFYESAGNSNFLFYCGNKGKVIKIIK